MKKFKLFFENLSPWINDGYEKPSSRSKFQEGDEVQVQSYGYLNKKQDSYVGKKGKILLVKSRVMASPFYLVDFDGDLQPIPGAALSSRYFFEITPEFKASFCKERFIFSNIEEIYKHLPEMRKLGELFHYKNFNDNEKQQFIKLCSEDDMLWGRDEYNFYKKLKNYQAGIHPKGSSVGTTNFDKYVIFGYADLNEIEANLEKVGLKMGEKRSWNDMNERSFSQVQRDDRNDYIISYNVKLNQDISHVDYNKLKLPSVDFESYYHNAPGFLNYMYPFSSKTMNLRKYTYNSLLGKEEDFEYPGINRYLKFLRHPEGTIFDHNFKVVKT